MLHLVSLTQSSDNTYNINYINIFGLTHKVEDFGINS